MKKSENISAVVFLCLFNFISVGICGEVTIAKLTNNDYTDWECRVSNGRVVWEGGGSKYSGGFENYEIYYYVDGQVVQLTNSQTDQNHQPAIDENGNIVWRQGGKIILFNGQEILQVGTGSSPRISGGQVAWFAWDGHDYEIFLYDGSQVVQLSNNDYNDQYPEIYAGQVAWLSYDGHDYEIFLYGDGKVLQLTNDDFSCWKPQIGSGGVVWQGYNGNNHEIFYYDGTQVSQMTHTLRRQQNPQIDNGQIVWEGYDDSGSDTEIFFFDGGNINRITSNDFTDSKPRLCEGRTAWEGWNGVRGVWDIFLYDGGKVNNLTNNITDHSREPYIDRNQIVWYGTSYDVDGGHGWEIFLAEIKSASLNVLDGSDFSAGTEVSDDPEKLVSQDGTAVQGVVADGVTRLLIKADVAGPSQMTISIANPANAREDGVFRSIDGIFEGSSITVNSVTTSQGEKIFAIYQAPQDFVRQGHEAEDGVVSERRITFKIKINSQESTFECRILRPPVVLVHGLWSTKAIWYNFVPTLQRSLSGTSIISADYWQTNDKSFEVNNLIVKDYIKQIRAELKEVGIANIQADVIGHSMGGLLARIYAGEETPEFYKRIDNFRLGDIHKLITIDSPHHGSFLADVAMDVYESSIFSPGRLVILNLFNFLKMRIDQGAVKDLMTGSEAIENMNKAATTVASHVLVGDYVVRDGDLNNIENPELRREHKLLNFFNHNTLPTLVLDRTDLVVSGTSQMADLYAAGVDIYSDFDHLTIVDSEKSGVVVSRLIDLLNSKIDDTAFRKGFKET